MDSPGSIPTEATVELKPCAICGRTFRLDTLERHQRICQKAAEKKRKVFDSKKQRALALEGLSATTTKKETATGRSNAPNSNKTNNQKSNVKPKSNWREKHEDLIRTIRRSRESDKDGNDSGEADSKSRIPSDYVQCPGCKRHFNQRAAERHIPWCQEKQQQQQQQTPPVAASDAKEKLIARVRYRVPMPGRVKKAAKPKTAGAVESTNQPEESNRCPEREKESYSSPPSLMDKRNAARQNIYYRQKREPRNNSRSRERNSVTPPETDPYKHIIKFKEKFPNRNGKRGLDLEESFSTDQLQELLRCSRLSDGRCPKTVPGVRLLGSKVHNNWTSELNINSIDYTTKLPEVSSSELSDSWMKRLAYHRDFDTSTSSSGSSSSGSLPPMSRESPSDGHLNFHCHQCHHKFPLVGAKYCCECGARRRGLGLTSQTV